MAKVLFKLDKRGVGQLLTSPEMQSDILGRARRVASAAGDGHSVDNRTTNRARAVVATSTHEAAKAEAETHTLTSAIDAGRSR